MPTLHDLMSESIDGRARVLQGSHVAPTDATRGLIGRRRRRNAAMAGGSSALAVGALVAAGVVQQNRADDDSPASADPHAVAFATVPAVSENGPYVVLNNDSRIACGDAVPESEGSLDGFALETQVFTGSDTRNSAEATLDDGTSVLTTVTYSGSPHAPVFLDVGYGVLAKDGVVVALVDQASTRSDLRFSPLLDGYSWTDVVNLGRNLDLCPDSPLEASSYDELTLPAGDYQFYAVAHANVTEEMIGLHVLAEAGYGPVNSQGAWAPGSIDCARQLEYRESDNGPADPLPLACEPDGVPGASIDADAGTISVPYPAVDYTEDVDVTVVSEALPIRLSEPLSTIPPEMWVSIDGYPDPTPASALECGLDFSWIETDAPVDGRVADGIDALLANGSGPILLDEWADPAGATVTLGASSEAWLTGRDNERGNYIAGHATATFTPSREIVIDRYSEYPEVSLTLTDVTWCEPQPDPVQSIIIKGAVSVIGTDGTVSRGTSWSIQLE
jgi:hypothetical protein